jgi:nitroreductase
VIRQRRSAQAMDGRTPLARDRFYAMLARLVPALCSVPWDALGPPVLAHLGLFVHRVEGLDPGLYMLVRDPLEEPGLRAAIRPDAAWRRPPGCPQPLALYLLRAGDLQSLAARVSCDQELAGDGAFSAGMLVAFDRALASWGAPVYRRLFWETGMVGQVLYLEAEAAGLRGTGIGCFYDDPVHAVFGLADTRYQSLYHFTVGGPVDDPRLAEIPAYAHLDADR